MTPPSTQLAVAVHAYADPEAATGDAVLGYLPDPPQHVGRFREPVELELAGRWPRDEAYRLATEYDGVHKWRGKRARRWAIAVPAPTMCGRCGQRPATHGWLAWPLDGDGRALQEEDVCDTCEPPMSPEEFIGGRGD